METTEIILIRHGETAENLQGILQGHLDTVLNANGIAQAEAAARRLKREAPFQALYSSDLKRAAMTAEIIAGYLRLPVNLNPRLREWHLGEYEGRNWKELEEHAKPVMEAFRHEPRQEIKISGGETRAEFQLRVEAVLNHIAAENAGRRVLIVTHGGVLLSIFRYVVGATESCNLLPLLSNTGYHRIVRRGSGAWQLCVWNDTMHLADSRCQESVAF